jgi:hypothetical protein
MAKKPSYSPLTTTNNNLKNILKLMYLLTNKKYLISNYKSKDNHYKTD